MTSTCSFVPTRQDNPFLVCGDIQCKCRQTEALNLCMTSSGALPGFGHLEQTKDGLWAKYIIEDGIGLNQEDLRVEVFRGIGQSVTDSFKTLDRS